MIHSKTSTLLAGVLSCAACADMEPSPFVAGAEIAFPGRGEIRSGVFDLPAGEVELRYRWVDGHAVVDGDILLPAPRSADASSVDSTRRGLRKAAFVTEVTAAPWPNGTFRYVFDASFVGFDDEVDAIEEAIAIWDAATSLTFIESSVGDHVIFSRNQTGDGCESFVGRVADGAGQIISLEGGVCGTGDALRGTALHEIGHALGLLHEHSRPDRNEHVIFQAQNVPAAFLDDVEIPLFGAFRTVGKYNRNSIMHYGPYTNDPATAWFTKLNGRLYVPNREAPTDRDICGVERANGLGRRYDVTGSGYSDLAIGIPFEDLTYGTQGAVIVSYGGSGGVGAAEQLVHRGGVGVDGAAQTGAQFGSAIAMGDFDGDCKVDVAVGVPYEQVGALAGAGTIHIFYGSGLGLAVTNDEVFHPNGSKGGYAVAGASEANAHFGATLASGDFNGDGYADLAVGSPDADVGGHAEAGTVTVLYGGADGVLAAGSQRWSEDIVGIVGVPATGNRFGVTLAAGDFNGDGFDELAVGVPHDTDGSVANAGSVLVIRGSLTGLTADGNVSIDQSTTGISGLPQVGDYFGGALAVGDLDGTGIDDLIVGVPYEHISGVADAGRVVWIPGGVGGLIPSTSVGFNQNHLPGVSAQTSDFFGFALVADDFDADGYDDLAVGAPCENVGESCNGAVSVVPGGTGGPQLGSAAFWTQDSAGLPTSASSSEYFGRALATGDFDGDRYADLVIAAPYEDAYGASSSGALLVLYGGGAGLTSAGATSYTQESTGAETSEIGDAFGFEL